MRSRIAYTDEETDSGAAVGLIPRAATTRPEDAAAEVRLPEDLSKGIDLPVEEVTRNPAGAEGSDQSPIRCS